MNNIVTNLNSLDNTFKSGVNFVKSVKDCESLLNVVENSGYIRLRLALRVIGYIQTGFSIFVALYFLYLLIVSGGHREGRLVHMWKHYHKNIITLLITFIIIIVIYQLLDTYVKHYIENLMVEQIDNIIGCSMELVKRISNNEINNHENQVQDATNVIPNNINNNKDTNMNMGNMYSYN